MVIKMFIVVYRLFAFDLSPHGVALASGYVANIAITNDCGVGYFLQKIGYFLHFRLFPGVFRGNCGKLAKRAKNGNVFRFYEMRCSEKLQGPEFKFRAI